jgi:hypothetical protein
MKYTEHLAHEIAQRIYSKYAERIQSASDFYRIPAHWFAGLTGMENPQCHEYPHPDSMRFERVVYVHLIAVKDGISDSYKGITQSMLKGQTEKDIRNLSTSYGQTQIMGYHLLTPALRLVGFEDLRNPKTHYGCTGMMFAADHRLGLYCDTALQHSSADQNAFFRVAHIWNSGWDWDGIQAHIKTYSPDYMGNCWAVAKAYKTLTTHSAIDELLGSPSVTQQPESKENGMSNNMSLNDPIQSDTPQFPPSATPVPITPGWKTTEGIVVMVIGFVISAFTILHLSGPAQSAQNASDAVVKIFESVGPMIGFLTVLWNYITSRGKLKSNAVNAATRVAAAEAVSPNQASVIGEIATPLVAVDNSSIPAHTDTLVDLREPGIASIMENSLGTKGFLSLFLGGKNFKDPRRYLGIAEVASKLIIPGEVGNIVGGVATQIDQALSDKDAKAAKRAQLQAQLDALNKE